MAKILHCADLHLDSPFQALSPEKAHVRRREQKETVRSIVELANDERVDLMLMSGDLFDGRDAFYDTVFFLANELKKARCKVFIAPGNHDYYGADSPYRSVLWPENVHIFKSPRIEKVLLPGLSVYGAGFDSAAVNRPILQEFCVSPGEDAVMVLHGDTLTAGSQYNPVTQAAVAKSGLLYLALGHVHAFSGLLTAGATVYAYPGCAEGRGFDEQGEKGVILGEVARNRVDLKFVPVAKRRYREITVPVGDIKTLFSLSLLMKENLPKSASPDILRFILKGETDLAIDTAWLEKELSDRAFSVSVRDNTLPKQDLWESLHEDSLKGIFLKRMKERLENAQSDEDRERIVQAARFGFSALKGENVKTFEGDAV